MNYANDNETETYFVLFFESEADDAMSTSIEGPFESCEAAEKYAIGAYMYAKENGIPWYRTEITTGSRLED